MGLIHLKKLAFHKTLFGFCLTNAMIDAATSSLINCGFELASIINLSLQTFRLTKWANHPIKYIKNEVMKLEIHYFLCLPVCFTVKEKTSCLNELPLTEWIVFHHKNIIYKRTTHNDNFLIILWTLPKFWFNVYVLTPQMIVIILS